MILNEDNNYKVNLFYDQNKKYRKISYLSDSLSNAAEFNNDRAARIINGEVHIVNNRDFKSELFSYLVISMPAGIKTEMFNEVRFGKRNDDPLNYIFLKKEDSLIMILGIDPADNFVKKIEIIKKASN